MKKLILAAAALMVSLAAYGQGQVSINNRVVPDVTARLISMSDPAAGTSSSIGSPDWTVSFVGGAKGTAVAAMTPLLDASNNPIGNDPMRGAAGSAAAGYFTPVTAAVPNVAGGAAADIAVIVHGPNSYTQTLGPYSVAALGGGTITPPNLPMGTSPITINNGGPTTPEPTTLALGALGLGALLVIRRRK